MNFRRFLEGGGYILRLGKQVYSYLCLDEVVVYVTVLSVLMSMVRTTLIAEMASTLSMCCLVFSLFWNIFPLSDFAAMQP